MTESELKAERTRFIVTSGLITIRSYDLPFAGWLYDITGTYDLSFYLAGLFIALSGALLLVMPLMNLYRKWRNGESNEGTADKDFNAINNV